MLLSDGNLFLQLHLIEQGHHDHEVSTKDPLGHGVVVVIYVDDAERLFSKAKDLDVSIISDLKFNEVANMHEFVVRDPNEYSIMVCQALWATEQ